MFYCLTHNKQDFVGPIQPSNIISLKIVKDPDAVAGEGLVEWNARNSNRDKVTIRVQALYVSDDHIRIFYPQV